MLDRSRSLAAMDALLSSSLCSCSAVLFSSQHTMVCRRRVNFLAEPRRRKGVLRKDANCAWFHSAASINARP